MIDQNTKLSVFATRPAIYAPFFNWITEFVGTAFKVAGVQGIYLQASNQTPSREYLLWSCSKLSMFRSLGGPIRGGPSRPCWRYSICTQAMCHGVMHARQSRPHRAFLPLNGKVGWLLSYPGMNSELVSLSAPLVQGRTLYQPAAGLFPQFSSLYVSLWFFLIILGLGGPTGALCSP